MTLSVTAYWQILFSEGGRGGTPLHKANGDVPLVGIAFLIELLECDCTFPDFWGKTALNIYG